MIGFLIGMILKGSLIILLAVVANLILKSSSAAIRHWIWCLAFGSLLLLLPLSLFLPKKQLPVLPQTHSVSYSVNNPTSPVSAKNDSFSNQDFFSRTVKRENPIRTPKDTQNFKPLKAEFSQTATQQALAEKAQKTKNIHINWPSIIIILWISGVIVFLLRLFWSITRIWKMANSGHEILDKNLKRFLKVCMANYRISGPVRMITSNENSIPATFGFARSVLLLPENFSQWPTSKQKAVIIHELAHIKRRDYFFNLIAQTSCALYWFNPLVWIAIRYFWIERENACDDLVLQKGIRDYEYADQLLEIASQFSRLKPLRRCASVMASKTDLKKRIKRILSQKISRRSLTWKTIILSSVGVLFIIMPLAVAHIQEKQNEEGFKNYSYRKSLNMLTRDLQNKDPEIRLRAAWALGEREDNDAVPALIRALQDSDPEVKGMVAWALGEIKDKRAISPLVEVLNDKNPYVREMLVKALGEFEDERVVNLLGSVLKDKNPDVRTSVVWAMGEIKGNKAYEIIIKALKDANRRVREMAVSLLADFSTQRTVDELKAMLNDRETSVKTGAIKSLGTLKSRKAVDVLIKTLNDQNAEIRLYAAWALGNIGDPRAVEPLLKLLRDKDPQVRSAAIWSLDEISLH